MTVGIHVLFFYFLIQTEYEGQAKKYMDVLEDTDAIVVAGGDGTIAEVFCLLLDF